MTPRQRMEQDRALRDAALRLFKADTAMVREDLAEKGVGARAASRFTDAAMDMLDEAVDSAEAHKGALAGGLALAVLAGGLWFARGPILAALEDALHDAAGELEDIAEQAEDAARSAVA